MEFDQEKNLDEANKIIKVQAYHLNKMIDNNNLRQCLKETSIMLSELKTSLLTPRNYYSIFTVILDELQFLEQFFKEEYRRGRRMKHLYDSVQQAQNIIPRLYLMITVGRVYIDSGETTAKNMLFELLNAIKGVQNPTRGLFLRYYLLKMMKDKLPDTKEDIDFSLKFILQNLEEMNRLWIRLSTGCSGNEKLIREKERNELKVLVGENIIRISDLCSLTVEKYQSDVLPKIITILLETKDTLSQQYILECVIHAFTETFNISCMNIILETLSKVVPTVDIKSLFINLMEKLSKFIGDEQKRKEENQEHQQNTEETPNNDNNFDVQVEIEKIFGILKSNIDKLVEDSISSKTADELKIIELLVAFMKFTLKCCPNNQKIETVNHICKSVYSILKESSSTKQTKDTVKQVLRILNLPLENKISIFKIPLFSELMAFLDYSSRSTLALTILDNLSQVSRKKVYISDEIPIDNQEADEDDILNTPEKILALLGYIRPLTENSSDSLEIDKAQFTYEQLSVSKFIFAIKEKNPEKYSEMLKLVQKVFILGGESRVKFTIPTLINVYINLINNCYYGFLGQSNQELLKDKTPYHIGYLNNFEIQTSFPSKDKLINFCNGVYDNIINLTIGTLKQIDFNLYFQILLNILYSLNTCIELDVKELSFKIMSYLLDYLREMKNEQSEIKLNLLILLINSVLSLKCFSQENYNEITTSILNISSSFVKRFEQSKAMLNTANLYIHDVYEKNEEKCKEALSKSVEYADYAMSTNTQACLTLYILLINKYLYFIQKGINFTFITSKRINKLLEKVTNCIKSIKTEHQNLIYLKDIEDFYDSTIDLIKIKKSTSDNKIYSEINVSFE